MAQQFPKGSFSSSTAWWVGAALTCAHSLPAHREGRPCLHHVHGDGAVVVCSGPPGQLGRGVGDLINRHVLGGTWGTCQKHCRRDCLKLGADCGLPALQDAPSREMTLSCITWPRPSVAVPLPKVLLHSDLTSSLFHFGLKLFSNDIKTRKCSSI